ncbi:MAG: hypothetical protein NZ551_01475 [Microscillaceae bacterium]|nr:hypothetical protein [Microscillaceae bacterium]MDW8459858.1 hypothetical protein [Cytophagales bacterium]
MPLQRILSIIIATLGLLLFSRCLFQKPSFSFVPEISFKRFDRFLKRDPFLTGDSVRININYRDGDGDLGLADRDTVGAYRRFVSGTVLNRFFNNFFVRIFRVVGNTESEIILNNLTYDGRFPLLNPDLRRTPLEGVINYGIDFAFFQRDINNFRDLNNPNRILDFVTLRFKIQIADRALNLSNEVSTDTLRISRRQ